MTLMQTSGKSEASNRSIIFATDVCTVHMNTGQWKL